MTNPSEPLSEFRVTIVKRLSVDLLKPFPRYVWQVRVFKKSKPMNLQVKFESDDWNKAMTYGNELARIFQ